MKIVYKAIDKNGAGTITVITESLEDMWHAYNLITAGDRVRASTFRKVAKETATGSTEKERKRITVTIEVKAIDFDANSGIIRLNGQNVEENQFIKVCSYLFGLDLEKITYLINNIIRTKQCDNSIAHYCRTCIIGALLPNSRTHCSTIPFLR
jgi:stalled ribosome rescue protein Dom34